MREDNLDIWIRISQQIGELIAWNYEIDKRRFNLP